ncbi:hypothetical protein LWI29_000046 [Acer saccharum]|uniref:(S)-2-hydroxy-acid oxidase n=1 Tax=Acer saccharum TaxID=4024 RepID=A0AA39VGG7_ACESA|nr:hypothetical protein LWI29_000046 [Acer saccharum]
MEEITNVMEYQAIAKQKLPKMIYDYYASGAEDQWTLEENRNAFSRILFRPRILIDVSKIDMATTVLGFKISMPIMIAPTAMQKMAHPDGEYATARAASAAGTIMTLSSWSTSSVEEVASTGPGIRFFQLYVYKDRHVVAQLVRRAERAGFKAIALTVDTPRLGRREADIKNRFVLPPNLNLKNFEGLDIGSMDKANDSGLASYVAGQIDRSLSWKDVKWLQTITSLPILVKGVITAEDTRIAIQNGAAGIIVSNHGARQLDYVPATIMALEEVVKAAQGRVPVFVDGGIRRGTDVFKALALGASGIFIGRPVVFSLAAEGEAGVRKVLEMLRDEFELTMALSGCRSLKEITRDHIKTDWDPPRAVARFIPNRSAMDFDYAYFMINGGKKKGKEDLNPDSCFGMSSPSREAYRRQLAEIFNMNRGRILAFKNKPPTPVELIPQSHSGSGTHHSKPTKPRMRRIPQKPEKILDAPYLVDDYRLNLLDWGSSNVLAIALNSKVYLWDTWLPSHDATSELVNIDDQLVTSVSWAPDGRRIAIGWNNSQVQIWDSSANRKLRTMRGGHTSEVGSLAWNNQILTTGDMDGNIVNNDVRIRDHVVETYRGHTQEVCGLKWSPSGQQLASGGNDNLLHIWDNRKSTQWLHRLEEHTSAVRALAWCPFQGNLLATGGGDGDGCIKFWNTHTGACLNSIDTTLNSVEDTGSQVCALLWNNNERELLSSHGGFTQNQLTLWKYPSMVKTAELTGHTSRVLFMAQSPNGCTVASAAAAADETLRLWNVFGDPQVAKPASKAVREPVAHLYRTSIR